MEIDDDNPSSILLDHLLVYVGAKLEIRVLRPAQLLDQGEFLQVPR